MPQRAGRVHAGHGPTLSRNSTATPSDLPVGELLKRASEQTSRLVREELRLAQLEMQQKAKHAGIGVGLFGAAGVVALFGAASDRVRVLLLATAMDAWLAALIVAVVLLATAGGMALAGKSRSTRRRRPSRSGRSTACTTTSTRSRPGAADERRARAEHRGGARAGRADARGARRDGRGAGLQGRRQGPRARQGRRGRGARRGARREREGAGRGERAVRRPRRPPSSSGRRPRRPRCRCAAGRRTCRRRCSQAPPRSCSWPSSCCAGGVRAAASDRGASRRGLSAWPGTPDRATARRPGRGAPRIRRPGRRTEWRSPSRTAA